MPSGGGFLLRRCTDFALLCGSRGLLLGFPGGSDGKASACNAGDPGSIPGLGRSPGEGNGNPLQYSCLGNPTDGGAWLVTVHGVTKSDMTEQLQFQFQGFPGGSDGKESAGNAGDLGSIPGSGGRSPGEGVILRYSCLDNSTDRRAWRATVCGVTKSQR